ncbi:RagB/SusD family nutrient uptake outer membrane protein [Chitinophaga sp.]|uniref:RagB/SusD family nutrient uptake outer membrane protein n=1 Tax=Chitinophaga sp. TaxID=1869181 RepID=UPI0026130214|nr:RagB/SusD family nutrient uptake outer membrane protein [uncultured Chitinophaga sp.]
MQYRIIIILAFIIGLTACKNLLDVEPVDRLGANSFWKTRQDVESAVADAYGFIYDKLTYGPYHNVNGDIRAGEFDGTWVVAFKAVAENDLANRARVSDPTRYYVHLLDDWYPFYQAIAACNIAIDRIPEVPGISENERQQFLAEVRFVRAFTYFYIVRIYGDVPLYTQAYDPEARPRTKFSEVLKFCTEELEAVKDNLPWQYEDPTNWGVRASRASALALIAHCNMWMAGFDAGNAEAYNKKAAEAALAVKQSGYFELLPIEDFKRIFKGRTKESIFEFSVNKNYGQETKYVSLGQWTTHDPVVNYGANSDCFYEADFLERMYPAALPDKRRDLWFYLPYINNTTAMFLKYSNVTDVNNYLFDDNMIIFRYSDVLLLGAEALANTGRNGEAIALLDEVRERAGANPYNAATENLKDAIFNERQKELIGEGMRWYDLVRTGRVKDPAQCKNYLTEEQFNQGAWTWPIASKAQINNPNIVLNNYWIK